ncbi:MAG: hypothetical protein ACSLFA_03405, partial [Mycobacterium sp.]
MQRPGAKNKGHNENRPAEHREFPRGPDRAVLSSEALRGGLLRLVDVHHVGESADDEVLGFA